MNTNDNNAGQTASTHGITPELRAWLNKSTVSTFSEEKFIVTGDILRIENFRGELVEERPLQGREGQLLGTMIYLHDLQEEHERIEQLFGTVPPNHNSETDQELIVSKAKICAFVKLEDGTMLRADAWADDCLLAHNEDTGDEHALDVSQLENATFYQITPL